MWVFLYGKKERIVHNVVLSEYFRISLNVSHDFFLIFLAESKNHFLFADIKQVNILQSGGWLQILFFDLSVYKAAFEIKHVHNIGIIRFLGVSHEYQVHGLLFFHFDGVYSVDSCEQGLCVSGHMREISLEQVLERVQVRIGHRLYYEVFVVREKEEAATLSLGFTSLEHLISVQLSIQALLDHLEVNLVDLAQETETVRGVLCHRHVLIDYQVGIASIAVVKLHGDLHIREQGLLLHMLCRS